MTNRKKTMSNVCNVQCKKESGPEYHLLAAVAQYWVQVLSHYTPFFLQRPMQVPKMPKNDQNCVGRVLDQKRSQNTEQHSNCATNPVKYLQSHRALVAQLFARHHIDEPQVSELSPILSKTCSP